MRSSETFSNEENIRKQRGIFDLPSALKTEESTLYIKRNGKPIKYILRYKTASEMMFPGVFSAFIIEGENKYPKKERRIERIRNDIRDVETDSLRSLYLREPNALLTRTLPPTPQPIATAMKTLVREYDAPTAASAFSPTKSPTITESVIVYNCWKRLPSIMGRENINRAFNGRGV